MEETQTLAQRCFALEGATDELFERVNEILGCDLEGCSKEGFVWGATDTWWDSYDSSVEVIRPVGSEWMTREQADKILELGFGQIWESIGTDGRQWSRTYHGKSSPKIAGEVQRLRAVISDLSSKLEK